MKTNKATVSILIILVGLSSYLYYQNTTLEEKLSHLTQSYILVNNQLDRLYTENNHLAEQYTDLLRKFNELNESYNTLLEEGNITRVMVLEDHDYLNMVKDLIQRANKSIYIAIYVIKYDAKHSDDPVNSILMMLVEASRRGLDIKILVDDPTKRSYPETIIFLKNNGIPVKLDRSSGITSHMKIVIIDGEYLVVGSHNWTESALTRNHEFSVLIESRYIASKATQYFLNLWQEGRNL